MTQEEAIRQAKRMNRSLRKHFEIIVFVAKNKHGEWFGYSEEPEYCGKNELWHTNGAVYRIDELTPELSLAKL